MRALCTAIALALSVAVAAPPAFAAEGDSREDNAAPAEPSTLETLRSYSADKREQAVARAEELMNELDARIARLRERLNAQWSEMSEATRRKTRETLESLEDERAALGRAYQRLSDSSVSAWEDVKRGFTDSYRVLREHFDRTRAQEEETAGESGEPNGG